MVNIELKDYCFNILERLGTEFYSVSKKLRTRKLTAVTRTFPDTKARLFVNF